MENSSSYRATSPGAPTPRSWLRPCRPRSTTGAASHRISRHWRNRWKPARCHPRASTSTTRIRRCRAPINGPTARPTSNHRRAGQEVARLEMPPNVATDPLMYQGGSDSFLAPRDPIRAADEAWGIDMEGEIAVIVDDVPMGATRRARRGSDPPGHAGQRRQPAPAGPAGTRRRVLASSSRSRPRPFRRSRSPRTSLSDAWDGGKLSLPLLRRPQRQAVRPGRTPATT